MREVLEEGRLGDHASFFSWQPGRRGLCAHAMIATHRDLDLRTVLSLCFKDPNCTHLSYSAAKEAVLCSGMGGLVEQGADGSTVQWLAADKRGCEGYDVASSAVNSRRNMLPECSAQYGRHLHSTWCACSLSPTNVSYCLSATHPCGTMHHILALLAWCMHAVLLCAGGIHPEPVNKWHAVHFSDALPVSSDGSIQLGTGEYVCIDPQLGTVFLRDFDAQMCTWDRRPEVGGWRQVLRVFFLGGKEVGERREKGGGQN